MKQAMENCLKALGKLTQFLKEAEDLNSELSQAAVIQAFEYNYELFWKIFKKVAATEGLDVGSPKQAIAAAYQLKLIRKEEAWLNLIRDRNLTTHTYQEVTAEAIFQKVRDEYHQLFSEAYAALENYLSAK